MGINRKKLFIENFLAYGAINALDKIVPVIMLPIVTHLITDIECDSQDSKRIAYEIIAENRQAKGYPLRMTFKQIYDTMQTVDSKVFIVKNALSEYIASAFVYHVNNSIAQVIYWGDKPGNSQYKSINFIAYRLLQYYHGLKFKYLDIGPSTENSIPNFGLCDFKESILCSRSLKFSLQKDYI